MQFYCYLPKRANYIWSLMWNLFCRLSVNKLCGSLQAAYLTLSLCAFRSHSQRCVHTCWEPRAPERPGDKVLPVRPDKRLLDHILHSLLRHFVSAAGEEALSSRPPRLPSPNFHLARQTKNTACLCFHSAQCQSRARHAHRIRVFARQRRRVGGAAC